jgi:hypothetical protein
MIHVLAIVAVIGRPLLRAMGGIVGTVDVEHEVGGTAVLLPCAHVNGQKRVRQRGTGVPIYRVLQARERRLTGQVGLTLRTPAADSGRRPQTSLSKGSERRVSASFWSS